MPGLSLEPITARVRHRWLALASVLLCGFAACGGNVSGSKPGAASAGAAGQAGLDAGSAGVEPDGTGASRSSPGAAGIADDAGSGSVQGGALAASAGESGAASETGGVAGSGGGGVTVHLSGTHACIDPRECFSGLSCRGRAGHELTLCLAPCDSDSDCSRLERCIHPSDPFGPDVAGCFLTCDDSPLDCPLLFDCEDPSGQRTYTCLPINW